MFSNLPPELCSTILEQIDDPIELMKLRRVCRDWYVEINRILSHIDWKNVCLNKVPEFSLHSIIKVVAPKLKVINYEILDVTFWKKVYYHYIKWTKIINTPTQINEIKNVQMLEEDEYINCLDVWMNWIAYGTNHGAVVVYSGFNKQDPGRNVYFRNGPIVQVKLWHNDDDFLFLVSLTKTGTIRFQNMMHRNQPTIQTVSSGYLMCTGTANNFYASWGNILVCYKMNSEGSDFLELYFILEFQSNSKTVAMSSYKSKIFLAVEEFDSIKFFIIVDEFFKGNRGLYVESIVSSPLPLNNADTYVSVGPTIFCTNGTIIAISSPDFLSWATYEAPIHKYGFLTSLTVHGNYLTVGTNTGNLCMYRIKSTRNQSTIDSFVEDPVKIIEVCTSAIVDVKITQTDEEKVSIVAITKEKIFIISV